MAFVKIVILDICMEFRINAYIANPITLRHNSGIVKWL
jgi:hypothetical protein